MAVPDTTTFTLQDVVDEINPTTDDLVDCIADANEGGYDPAYYTAPATSLLEFRNYEHIPSGLLEYYSDVTIMSTPQYTYTLDTSISLDRMKGLWTNPDWSGSTQPTLRHYRTLQVGTQLYNFNSPYAPVSVAGQSILKSLKANTDLTQLYATWNSSGVITALAQLSTLPATDSTPPSIPTGLNITGGPTNYDLNWTASTDADPGVGYYKVYKDDVLYHHVFYDETLQISTSGAPTEEWKVEAYDEYGNASSKSAGFTLLLTPEAPTALTATLIGNTTFTLGWTAPASGPTPTGYKVYKNGGLYGDVGLVTSEAIIGQTADANNTWTVKAYNAEGDGPASSGISVTQNPAVSAFKITTTSETTALAACQNTTTTTKYKTGTSGVVSTNDQWYEEAGAINLFEGDNNYYSDNHEESSQSWIVTLSGLAASVANC